MRHLIRNIFAMAVFAGMASTAVAEDAEKGIVVTSEGLSERCVLTLVLTGVDGKALEEGDTTTTFELDPGPHSFSGYGGEDPSVCATLSGENAIKIEEGERIGEGEVTVNVVAGTEYYLGVDVRSRDKSKWNVVAWKVKR